MTSRSGSSRRWPLLAVWLIVAPIGLLSGALWFLRWRGARADEAIEASWRRTLGGRTFLERYPATEDNRTTLGLEALGCGLGIDMAPIETPGRCHPSPEAASRFKAIQPALKKLLDPTTIAEDGALAAPPVALANYLAASRPTLDRATALLLTSPAPVWKLNLAAGFHLKIPNFLGVSNLERLLVAQAREQARAGRIDAAFEGLEAAWKYNQAILDQPTLIGQLIGQTILKMQLAALRGMPRAPAGWPARLTDLDLRHRMFMALQADVFIAFHTSTFDRPPPGAGVRPWWLARWALRDYTRRVQPILDELPRREVRSFNPDDFEREMRDRMPRWQFIARQLVPNFWDAWPRTAHLELASELTALALLERERLATGGPPRTFHQRPSRVEGLRWIYEDLPLGTRIRIDGRFLYPGPRPLPLTFLVRTAKPAAGT
ncbi:MAG TPA: hypothetical protein VN851_04730 [Thermoanaerobaculia bacterium]|nr:hypothetical protein [Thermoanaerobaculia bacterium]